MKFIRLNLLSVLGLYILSAGLLHAAENNDDTILPLPAVLEGKEMRITTIVLAPGQESSPHRHNAHVYVYVIEGQVEMQVRGGPLMLLGPGEMFQEVPTDIHQVSRNPSSTKSATIVVHMLKSVGVPVTVPAD
ncbi:MAG: cupin [SAR86 cluster bacterium]|uniref:Cupin n=1 Tax=SAR86 cluster bacterium TaxID=2030880 RepID=A0A2A5AVN0_9GAMM|nr:MAG: cupin [SAR86 cluster bacterium]